MYGRKNTVLKHFGADELATLGTLQAVEELRLQGEYVAPEATVIRRPPPDFEDYFEFDRPIPSGLPRNVHDWLVEKATSSTHGFRAGTAGNDLGSGSVEVSPAQHQGSETPRGPRWESYSEIASPPEVTSPERSMRSRSPTPLPYDTNARLQPQPFRAGILAAPGARSAQQSGAAASPGGDNGTPARRGLTERITGRTSAASRRSTSASASVPQRPASARRAGAWQRTEAAARVPASASYISDMRLDDMDEATRVGLMLNDPRVRQEAPGDVRSPPQPAGPGAAATQQSPRRGAAPGGSTGPQPGGSPARFVTSSRTLPDGTRTSASALYFERYRLRKHREAQGVPDYRYSQPRSLGVLAPIPQRYFSFDEAHPAIADEHYVRSPAQEKLLQAERRRLHAEKLRAAQAEERKKWAARSSTRPSSAPSATAPSIDGGGILPSARLLAVDVVRLARAREAGRTRLRELDQEGEALRQATRHIQHQAQETIRRSEHITASASHSLSVSPDRNRHRTHTSAYSHHGNAYSRGGFGDASYYSPSPSRRRAASAAAVGVHGQPYEGAYSEVSYTAKPTLHGDGQYEVDNADDSSPEAPQRLAPPMSMSPPPGPVDAQHILRTIDVMERASLPGQEYEGADSEAENGAAGNAADPLVRVSMVATNRHDMGALRPDEQRIATGISDKSRCQEYQRQVDLEMQRRVIDGGYESDLDRDEVAATLIARKEEERLNEQEIWERENEWMDGYRQRLGPEDGYLPLKPGSAGACRSSYSSRLQSQGSMLSDAEEELLQQPYLQLPGGYTSEGPDAYHPSRRIRHRLFNKSTVPKPFQFMERLTTRPKPIDQVKLEQDLALRKAEEDVHRQCFRAFPLPDAILEPRYERMLLEAQAKRQLNQQHRLEELASIMEKPFSFYYRQQERRQEREALAQAAKDPNRFQVAFRARDVPDSTKEERFRLMMLELEARRETSRRRVQEARKTARKCTEEVQWRREAASRAYKRVHAVNTAVHPYPPKPLPDFNTLHRQNDVQMARARAYIRKPVTVPKEFRLNGSTPEEQSARARKAEERRRRIILDMQVDAELLPEQRWPNKSPRGKVQRTPLPAYLVEHMVQAAGNRTASARKPAAAAEGDAYMTRTEGEVLERKASKKAHAEALQRAHHLLKAAQTRRQQKQRQKENAGGGEYESASDVGAVIVGGADQSSVARDAVLQHRVVDAGRQDIPEMYVEARHAQVERRVCEVVADALFDQGIEAYRYVEGISSSTGKMGGATGKDQD